MKKALKESFKSALFFVLGGIIFGGITYAATYNFASGDVEHTQANGTKTTVSNALNELYMKSIQGDAEKEEILSGKTALVGGELLEGQMVNHGSVSVNLESGETRSLDPGYYSNITVIAPVTTESITFTNTVQKVIKCSSDQCGGSSNSSGTKTWTVPHTGILVYTCESKTVSWDHADTDVEGGKAEATISCKTPSNSFVTEGDVLEIPWSWKWISGTGAWNIHKEVACYMTLLY